MLQFLKVRTQSMLRATGYELRPYRPLWRDSPEFAAQLKEILPFTLLSPDRLFMIYQLGRYASCLAGDFAELGVYRGGTARLLAKTCPQKRLCLFDTFSGMPAVDPSIDAHRQGDFADAKLDEVKLRLSDCPRVEFFPGFFPETASPVANRSFAMVYVDADIYQSTKDALAFFFPRLVPGGVMLFDDYGSASCQGVELAIREFVAQEATSPIITAVDQCALFKGSSNNKQN
jgi:hypothetical protein